MKETCVRGFHVYRAIWDAAVGEELECKRVRQPGGSLCCGSGQRRYDSWSCTSEDFTVVLPVFKHGGGITCQVIGAKRYSTDLPQRGLEVPCLLFFTGETKEISKLKACFKVKNGYQESKHTRRN